MLHLNLRISLCFMAIFYGKVCVTNAFSPKYFSPKRVVFAVKGHGMLLCVWNVINVTSWLVMDTQTFSIFHWDAHQTVKSERNCQNF